MKARWTDFAWSMLSQTADYILYEYGYTVFDTFLDEVDTCVNLLEAQPMIGSEERYLANRPLVFRSMVVGRHNKLVYTIDTELDIIYIVDFWDTRREPIMQSRSI